MSSDKLVKMLERLQKVGGMMTRNRSQFVLQTSRLSDLFMLTFDEYLSSNNEDQQTEKLLWSFLAKLCSTFEHHVHIELSDMKRVLAKLLQALRDEEEATQLQEKSEQKKEGNRIRRDRVVEHEKQEPDELTWNSHLAALKALLAIILSSHYLLDEPNYKEISSIVVTQLLKIYSRCNSLTGIYTVLELRETLLRIFRSLLLIPQFVRWRPLQPACEIFTSALNWEHENDIRLLCSESLLVLKLIARPKIPVEVVTFSSEDQAEPIESTATNQVAEDTAMETEEIVTKVNGVKNCDPQDDDDEIHIVDEVINGNSVTPAKVMRKSPVKTPMSNSNSLPTPGSSNYVTASEATMNEEPDSDISSVINELS